MSAAISVLNCRPDIEPRLLLKHLALLLTHWNSVVFYFLCTVSASSLFGVLSSGPSHRLGAERSGVRLPPRYSWLHRPVLPSFGCPSAPGKSYLPAALLFLWFAPPPPSKYSLYVCPCSLCRLLLSYPRWLTAVDVIGTRPLYMYVALSTPAFALVLGYLACGQWGVARTLPSGSLWSPWPGTRLRSFPPGPPNSID